MNVAEQYAKRRQQLGMDPNDFDRELRQELYAQLCVAWEEISEQQAEGDESLPEALKAVKSMHFDENHIVVIGKDGHISHFKFTLERLV